jgi:hypothetical protein
MIHQQNQKGERAPNPQLTALEFEVLVRASGTSEKYRKQIGIERLATQYAENVTHPDAVTAIRLILGIKVPNPSVRACEFAQDAMGSASRKPLTFERFGLKLHR